MGRPLAQAVEEQQAEINRLRRHIAVQDEQIAYVAKLAGVGKAVAAIRTYADIDNPAQPIADPAGQAPSETTEEAATPEAYDDVRRPGMTPGSVDHVPAETTDVVLTPGESLPTSPYGPNGLQDVTAPVEGTQTHVPNEQTRIETDVRVGDPMAPEIAFPWGMGSNNSNGGTTASAGASARFMASIRLARLQMAAGLVAEADDLVVAASIDSSDMSDEKIATQIETLGAVQHVAASRQQRPGNLVPRAASNVGQVQRTVPSVAGEEPISRTASTVSDDTQDADLFLQ